MAFPGTAPLPLDIRDEGAFAGCARGACRPPRDVGGAGQRPWKGGHRSTFTRGLPGRSAESESFFRPRPRVRDDQPPNTQPDGVKAKSEQVKARARDAEQNVDQTRARMARGGIPLATILGGAAIIRGVPRPGTVVNQSTAGRRMGDPEPARGSSARDVVLLKLRGPQPSSCMAGGPDHQEAYMGALNLPVEFVEGLRGPTRHRSRWPKRGLVGQGSNKGTFHGGRPPTGAGRRRACAGMTGLFRGGPPRHAPQVGATSAWSGASNERGRRNVLTTTSRGLTIPRRGQVGAPISRGATPTKNVNADEAAGGPCAGALGRLQKVSGY